MTVERKHPPPPPGWARKPVAGEDQALAKWSRYIRRLSTSVFYAHRLAMDAEDIAVDLQECLVRAWRRSFALERKEPSDGLVRTVLLRRVFWLRRDASAKYRNAIYNDSLPRKRDSLELESADVLVADEGPGQEDQLTQEELQEVCGALAYALRRNLPPAVFAVLHLRCVEELPAAQIAQMAELHDWRQVSDKVFWAKGRAQAFLKSLGIDDWETLNDLSAEEFAHDDLE